MISNLLTSFPPKSTPARTLPSLTPARKPAVGMNGSLFSFCSSQPKPTPTLPTLSATRRGPVQVRCLSEPDARRSKLWQKAEKGVVFIKALIRKPGVDEGEEANSKNSLTSVAAGFIVGNEGHVVTAGHAVYQGFSFPNKEEFCVAQQVHVSFFDPYIGSVKAEILTIVPGFDIAVLKLSNVPKSVSYSFRFSNIPPKIGETVNIIGHADVEFGKKVGLVSSPSRYPCDFKLPFFQMMFRKETLGFFVTELGVTSGPGFSGCPVFNDKGIVHGCVVGGMPDRISILAVPAMFCKKVLAYAKNKKKTDPIVVDSDSLITDEDVTMEARDAFQRKERFI